MSDRLDDILIKVENRGFMAAYGFAETEVYRFAEAKQAIVEAVEGLIGEDEMRTGSTGLWTDDDLRAFGRNEMREKMRKAIKEWQS